MRQLNLTNYTERVRDEKGDWKELPYEVKDSMIELLFARDLQLSGPDILERDDLARKIRDCADGSILLEEEEWNKLVQSVNTIRGLGRTDVELVRRILKAEKVEVEAKK